LKTRWEPELIEVGDVEIPKISDDEVLIKVAASGICGTDLEIYEATVPLPITLPRIIGHEFSGIIVKIGKEASTLNINVGDRVVSESGIVCRRCQFCKMGKHNLCLDRKPIGFAVDGAFTEYIKVPGINIHRLPNSVSLEEAALVEPMAVGVHSVIERAQVAAGDTVAIVGAGSIGLILLQLVKVSGASIILQMDTEEDRLKLARKLGADYTVNVKKDNPVEKFKQLTGNYADVVFEATGNPSAVNQAITLTRKGGKTALLGIHPKPLERFDVTHIVQNEKTILGCWTHSSSTWDRAISLLSSSKIKIRPIITHILPLEQAEYGFHLLKKREAVKVLLIPPCSDIELQKRNN